MKKYERLKEMTKKYLNGKLSNLRMEYNNPDSTNISIIYEDDSCYSYEYQIEVKNKTKKITFISHFCNLAKENVPLKRSKYFEIAVFNYLYDNKK